VTGRTFTELFYPALFAGATAMACGLLLFPRSAKETFATRLSASLGIIASIVEQSTADFFASEGDSLPSARLAQLRRQLVGDSGMAHAFEASGLEVSFSRLPVAAVEPLLATITGVKGWVACGLGLGLQLDTPDSATSRGSSQSERRPRVAFASDVQTNVEQLGAEVSRSFRLVQACVELTLKDQSVITQLSRVWSREQHSEFAALRSVLSTATLAGGGASNPKEANDGLSPDRAVQRQRKALRASIAKFREALQTVLGPDLPGRSTDSAMRPTADDPSQLLRRRAREHSERAREFEHGATSVPEWDENLTSVAFLMVSLMEIARDASVALKVSQAMLRSWHAHPRRTIWLPVVGWRSFLKGDAADQPPDEEEKDESNVVDEPVDRPFRATENLSREELAIVFGSEEALPKAAEDEQGQGLMAKIHRFSRRRSVVKSRMRLSRNLSRLKRNRHLRYAFKVALGCVRCWRQTSTLSQTSLAASACSRSLHSSAAVPESGGPRTAASGCWSPTCTASRRRRAPRSAYRLSVSWAPSPASRTACSR
jgi:hypothetical protein